MCSVEEDGDLQPLASEKRNKVKTCVKCGEPGVLITRIHDSFCKACFQVYVVHKFRAAIGKSKLIRDGEHVLVAFSGGANSAALLHLIQDGLSVRAHKKLRFIPTLLHVDECCVLDLPQSENQRLREKVSQLMTESGFPSYLTSLELGLNIDRNKKDNSSQDKTCPFWSTERDVTLTPPDVDVTDDLKVRLSSVLQGLSSTSSREDFIRNLRNQLIVCIARQMGFTKILTAECSTRLGVRILTDVSQGRGSQVALNTGFSDARNGDVMFVRPVRDLNAKELTLYNNMFGVDSVFIPCITTKGQPGASIERLAETFVTGLQADFASTVSNIVRTSEKLGLPDLNSTKCVLCQSPLDTDVGSASALRAVEFSLKLSRAGGTGSSSVSSPSTNGDKSCTSTQSAPGCCGQGDGSCQTRPPTRLETEEIMDHLCFGCRLSLRNFNGSTESLPVFVTTETEAARQRAKLREEIADFLLEDAEDS
ncbi:cytoplasmic tRNA 2-thiolation protein 2 [Aplysia californica]|uniref:Cytoplasmic tRNA 2-thiolation protein 2 n=1 Tax=Aplysia californica TaxID=6500 RepID=A0ABM0ZUS8_APLCA|nr:cytoplasmic tRNA 2-thiolation protein 2 [Aplysia californica]XP_012934883.1 cytoplasmic tRNA 2-thiolation protein 2 [Aplysia californica]